MAGFTADRFWLGFGAAVLLVVLEPVIARTFGVQAAA